MSPTYPPPRQLSPPCHRDDIPLHAQRSLTPGTASPSAGWRSGSETCRASETSATTAPRADDELDVTQPARRPRGGRRRRAMGQRRARQRAAALKMGSLFDADDLAQDGKRPARTPTAWSYGAEGDVGTDERGPPAPNRRRVVEKTLVDPIAIPRSSRENGSAKLQIGLDLDIELELKAKLKGDIALSLLVEDADPKTPQPSTTTRPLSPSPPRASPPPSTAASYLPSIFSRHSSPASPQTPCSSSPTCARPSPELRPDARGDVDKELFHMHVGKLRLRQRWLERAVSPSLTAAAVCAIAVAAFLAGVLASRAWDGVVLPWSWCAAVCGGGSPPS